MVSLVRRAPAALHAAAPWIYLLAALPLILFQVFVTPPFQTPDAAANFNRAYLLSRHQPPAPAAGQIEFNVDLLTVEKTFQRLSGPAPDIGDPARFIRAEKVKWNLPVNTKPVPAESVDVASLYPLPAFLPQIVALRLGQHRDMTITDTYRLCIAFTAAASVMIMLAALRIAQASRPLLFMIGTLPMTAALFAAVETDWFLIALGALLFALVERGLTSRRDSGAEALGVAACLLLIAFEKLPYLSLLPLLFLPGLRWSRKPGYGWGRRLSAAALITIAAGSWYLHAAGTSMVTSPAGTAQASASVDQPAAAEPPPARSPMEIVHGLGPALYATATTYHRYLINSAIGVLGWLSVPLGTHFYLFAEVVLLLAALQSPPPIGRIDRAIIGTSLLLGMIALGAVFYVVYGTNPAGMIDGLQGRYFLPLVGALGLALPRLAVRPDEQARRLVDRVVRMPLSALSSVLVFVAFPLVATIVAEQAQVMHYYRPTPASLSTVTSDEGRTVIPLSPGSSVSGVVPAAQITRHLRFDSAAILIGRYAPGAIGALTAEVCVNSTCAHGRHALDEVRSGVPSWVPLDTPLSAAPGDTVKFTFSLDGGPQPVAIYVNSVAGDRQNQNLQVDSFPAGDYGVHVTLGTH